MKTGRADAVDAYFESLFIEPDAVMDRVTAETARAGLPAIAVSPAQGKFLMILAAAIGARRILEIGALGGYSTIWLARALPAGGRVVTLDIDPASVATVRRNASEAGFADRIDVVEGPAAASLEAMIAAETLPFDFIFIDADKNNYPAYLGQSLRLARPGALIVADNVVRDGKVADAQSGDAMVEGVRAYLDQARRAPRLVTTALQTLGVKGYDGFAISLVR